MFEQTLCLNMATGTVIYSYGNDMASGSKNTKPSLSIIYVIECFRSITTVVYKLR